MKATTKPCYGITSLKFKARRNVYGISVILLTRFQFYDWMNHSKVNNSKFRHVKLAKPFEFDHTFMILHWATPVTVSGTPCAVSTPSHMGFKVITSSERRWTSVTSHQAHAHPPTIVRFRVDPQQPPEEKETNINHWIRNTSVLVFLNKNFAYFLANLRVQIVETIEHQIVL